MEKVVIIGANGQLGTDIVKVFSQEKRFKLYPLLHKDIEITRLSQVKRKLGLIKPDIVINTAAYHKVDEVEDNPEKAFKVNSIAQKNLAELCGMKNCVLVYVSTDYVFGLDKEREKPYKESNIPGPLNVYGISKLAGETFTKYLCKRHYVIRTSGLFGAAGSSGKGGNFVETMIRLGKEKGEVKVVSDQVLAPTYTKNVAENLLILLKTNNYGIYHMTSEGFCSWWEFANQIFTELDMKVKCGKVDSNHFNTRAKRPTYSVLGNYELKEQGINKMNNWKKNLRLYLKEKSYF